jgi:hypothetical protein
MVFSLVHSKVANPPTSTVNKDDWNDTHDPDGTGTLTLRPTLVAGLVAQNSKPTSVTVGAHTGYSLPVYNSDNEELFFRSYVPGRWDGESDITVSVICVLAGAEDVGDKFKLQLSSENKATASGVISTSTSDVPVETTIATDRAAQYSIYKVDFTVDWDAPTVDITASDHIGFRLRRIAASSLECSGEIIVLDCVISYTVDKIFKA